jgi:hypothetical protein
LTDSRFPGTTELLSAASVELKGVRANLEEQVRIKLVNKEKVISTCFSMAKKV